MRDEILGEAEYGDLMRPGVTYDYQDLTNCWFPGFSFRYGISCFENGVYEIEALATDAGGIQALIGKRRIYIENPLLRVLSLDSETPIEKGVHSFAQRNRSSEVNIIYWRKVEKKKRVEATFP